MNIIDNLYKTFKKPEPQYPIPEPQASVLALVNNCINGYNWAHKPNIKYIVMHHSLTDDGKAVEWDAIKKYHMGLISGSPYHMTDIGYNYGVELIGNDVRVRIGRPMTELGAHCLGLNSKSIGICVVGDYDKAMPDLMHWLTTLYLVRKIREHVGMPIQNVIGHVESFKLLGTKPYKTCPGLKWNMDQFRKDLTNVRFE